MTARNGAIIVRRHIYMVSNAPESGLGSAVHPFPSPYSDFSSDRRLAMPPQALVSNTSVGLCQLATDINGIMHSGEIAAGYDAFRIRRGQMPGSLHSKPGSVCYGVLGNQAAENSGVERRMRSNDSVNLDDPLGVPSGFEPSHAPLPFPRRLM